MRSIFERIFVRRGRKSVQRQRGQSFLEPLRDGNPNSAFSVNRFSCLYLVCAHADDQLWTFSKMGVWGEKWDLGLSIVKIQFRLETLQMLQKVIL